MQHPPFPSRRAFLQTIGKLAIAMSTLGAGAMLFALALYHGVNAESGKILVVAGLVLLSSPTAGHALARAAHRAGLPPWRARGAEKE